MRADRVGVWRMAAFEGHARGSRGSRARAALRTRGRTPAGDAQDVLPGVDGSRGHAALQRLIRTITDHLPGKVSYWDRDLRCRYANAAYFEWFGRHPEEMTGVHMREVYGEALYTQNEGAVLGALQGRPQRFERRIVKRDGTEGWLLANYIPDRVGDWVEGFYVLSTDITEVKQAGLQLERLNGELARRIEDVTAATRAKDDFLSNMSHEIRTPLNAILGLAYLLDARPLQPDEKTLVRKIRGAGRLLLGIISDILDYSKIEAGRLELEHVPFRLADVLDGVAAIMSISAGDKDIELAIDAVPPGAEHLLGDSLRIGQVLNNLVSNAIKFTEHGAVSVHVASEPLYGGAGRQLRFAVRDTGAGIAPEKHGLIFEAFSQADSSTTRRYGGTGLGLSICRRLVHQMGGEIGVRSEPGSGSEFWFTLPLEVAPDGADAGDLTRQRVLVADDSEIARASLCLTAESLGWEAEAVDSGAEAIDHWHARAAAGSAFDILLIDWQMPGIDGVETCRAIRGECESAPRSPIIAMVTAHSRELLSRQPEASVADVVLPKPVTASMLYDAVIEARRRGIAGAVSPAPDDGRCGRRLPGLEVLVVDDSEINCEVAARILEREGAHVQTVGDGRSAIDWLREWPDQADVVLMDVQMPTMDGYEAARRIRGELGRRDLPVVALTAGAFAHQRAAALAAGMDDFLAKPFDVDAMVTMLQRLTGWRAEPVVVQAHQASVEPECTPKRVTRTVAKALGAEAVVPGLAGVDLPRALAAWGDAPTLLRYLRTFAASFARAGDEIARAVASGRHDDACALAHKLAGAAGNLALTEVEKHARAIEASLREATAGTSAPDEAPGAPLQSAIDVVLAATEEWAVAVAPPSLTEGLAGPTAACGDEAVAGTLRELLAALDHDNPRHAEAPLAALAARLPASALAPIRDRIDAFDFRGAEARCRELAAALGPIPD